MKKRIIIMAGGTGGHVFPALAVAKEFINQGWDVSWIGTKKGLESRVVPENNIEIDWLSVNGLRGKGFLALLKMPWMLLVACCEARAILKRRQPDVVLGMGGFVAGPAGLLAKWLGIPLVIHEQNRIPGTTNCLLSKLATTVLEAFPQSFSADKQAQFTGNPLRAEFIQRPIEVLREATDTGVHVLILGGSLGAQRLNEVLPEALSCMDALEVHHQTGTKMQAIVEQQYKEKQIKATVTAFIDDMVAAYRWADVVICRAGAMTVSELMAAGLPSILVPYPYAIDDHQTANAQYLVEAGAGIMIPQSMLNEGVVAEKMHMLLKNKVEMGKAAKQLAQLQATQKVVSFCQQVAK